MNYLKGKSCYLSGPIEHDHGDFNWRTEPTKVLRERFDIEVFDPFSDPKQQWTKDLVEARETNDFDRMQEIAELFVRKDLQVVQRADFLLGYLPKGVATCGTHKEIDLSNYLKNPTILICPEGKKFVYFWYFAYIPHRHFFGDWESVYSYLDEVDNGLHKDDPRWSMVYGLL